MTEQEFDNIRVGDIFRLEDKMECFCVISKVIKIKEKISGKQIIMDDIVSIRGVQLNKWSFNFDDTKIIKCKKLSVEIHPEYFL